MNSRLISPKIQCLLLFTFLTLGFAQFNPICKGKRYMCDYNDEIKEGGVCMIITDTKNKLHLVKPCTDPSYPICNYTDLVYNESAYCTAPASPAVKRGSTLPGEKCKTSSECYSSTCKSGFCRGKKFNQTCSSDYDCDIGLFCSDTSNVCLYQKTFAAVSILYIDKCDLSFSIDLYKR